MSDKLVTNCTTGEVTSEDFTADEIAQRAYEASLPPVVPPQTDTERIEATEKAINAIMTMIM